MQQYQSLVDAEWKILYDKMEKMVTSGAQIVLSRLPIGDVATQYFADRDVFCAGRVPEEVTYNFIVLQVLLRSSQPPFHRILSASVKPQELQSKPL